MKQIWTVEVEIAEGPFEDGADKTRGDLECAIDQWIDENWSEADAHFKHNPVTNVVIRRIDESEAP